MVTIEQLKNKISNYTKYLNECVEKLCDITGENYSILVEYPVKIYRVDITLMKDDKEFLKQTTELCSKVDLYYNALPILFYKLMLKMNELMVTKLVTKD